MRSWGWQENERGTEGGQRGKRAWEAGTYLRKRVILGFPDYSCHFSVTTSRRGRQRLRAKGRGAELLPSPPSLFLTVILSSGCGCCCWVQKKLQENCQGLPLGRNLPRSLGAFFGRHSHPVLPCWLLVPIVVVLTTPIVHPLCFLGNVFFCFFFFFHVYEEVTDCCVCVSSSWR